MPAPLSSLGHGQYQPEAGAVRLHVLVYEVAAVRPRVRARDREAEPRARGNRARALATREALEQVWHEVGRDAAPFVLDSEPEVTVGLLGMDAHGRPAVPEGVRDEVGHDAFERVGVDERDRARRHVDLHGGEIDGATWTISSTCARTSTGSGAMSIASASSRERSSSCSTRFAMRWVCWSNPFCTEFRCSSSSRSPRWCRVVTKPWMVVIGVRSSCAARAMKFVFRASARSSEMPCLALRLKEADAIECEADERAERLECPQLLVAEHRCVRRRPDDHAAPVRHLELDHPHVVPQRGRFLAAFEACPGVVRYVPGGHDGALVVPNRDRTSTDDAGSRLEYAGGHLLLRFGEGQEACDRLLYSRLLRCAPPDAQHLRRREPDQERNDARGSEDPGAERQRGVLLRREHSEEKRECEHAGREREELHATPGDRGLLAACAPEAPGGDDGEHRPVDEEDCDECLEDVGARFPLLRDLREREGPDDEDRAEEDERVREPAVRGVEGVREPEEEVREDDEEGDDQAADCALGQVAGVVRDQA